MHPGLYFEYVPGLALDEPTYRNLSTAINKQILRQLLSALQYLHSLGPPIVHRDIKPPNILVTHFDPPSSIHVKFADFGLARGGRVIHTTCGTETYAALEVLLNQQESSYGVKVDIFSLGLVILFKECGPPEANEESSHIRSSSTGSRALMQEYAGRMAERDGISDESKELLLMIRDNMVAADPDERSTARQCLLIANNLSS